MKTQPEDHHKGSDFSAAPDELKELRQWVARRDKVLIDPKNGDNARTNGSSTWADFNAAVRRAEEDDLDGIGFVVTEDDPYAFVDLDGCVDPETGEITSWALEIIDRLDSYTELSSSGRGIHVVVRGGKPGRRCRDAKKGIEIYDRKQYLAITGRVLPGRRKTVEDRHEALAALHRETFPEGDGGHDEGLPSAASPPMEDEDVIRRCRIAKNGGKFAALHDDGDTEEYGSHSEADLALVSILAFYTQDPEQIDRLFRRSGLHREKWNRADYREKTIRKALSGRTEFYSTNGQSAIFDLRGIGDGDVVSSSPSQDTVTAVTTAPAGQDGAGLPLVPEFPVDALPPVLRRMAADVIREMNVPPEYFAAPALATLGSAVGGARFLRVHGTWKVRPGIAAATVAESSDKKTPAFKVATSPAMKLQDTFFEQWKVKKEEYEEEYRQWEVKKKNTPKKEVLPKEPEEPKLENAIAQDFTSEVLADILRDTPRGVLIPHDELAAFFGSLDQYKSGGRGSERQRHLAIMSNASFTIHRKSAEPKYVKNPVVSYTGNIQPDVLPAFLIPKPGGRKGDADDGMLHRWLFAYPEPVRTVDTLDSDNVISEAAKTRYAFLYKKLRDLEMDAAGESVGVGFTPEGKRRFNEVYVKWQERKLRPGTSQLLRSTYGKMADHTARIALLFALARNPDESTGEIVSGEDVDRAARVTDYFAAHARKVQDALRREKEGKEERILRVLSELLDEYGNRDGYGGRWRVATAKLRVLLLERSVYDVPERPEELTKLLTDIAERTPGLSVESGKRIGGAERGLEIIRALSSAVPPPQHGSDGSDDGDDDIGAESGQGPNTGELIVFALEKSGSAYPEDLVEATGRGLGSVKNALTKLRKAGVVEDTGNTNDKKAKEVRLAKLPEALNGKRAKEPF